MIFDASEFLEKLFDPGGDRPATATVTPVLPCPDCGCAIGWRRDGGAVICANCCDRPDGADKVLIVNLAEGNRWRNYAAELQEAIRRRSGRK